MDFFPQPLVSPPMDIYGRFLCSALLLYHNTLLRGYPYGLSRSICEHLIRRLRTLPSLDPQNRVTSLFLLTGSNLGPPLLDCIFNLV